MKKQPVTIISIQEDPFKIQHTSSSAKPKSKGSYWSWAFGFTMFPFVFWGCPFYLLLGNKTSQKISPTPIFNTSGWLKATFGCRSPAITIMSLVLIIPTVTINGYVMYVFGDLFSSLFVTGKYKMGLLDDVVELIRYLPIILPLDYVWLRGFKVNNMITALNNIYRDYEGVGCGTNFRVKVIILVVIIVAVHIIRYLCYDKYAVAESKTFWEALKIVFDFSVDIFSSFLMPLYCTFCYAITFQLFVIKAFIYKLVSRRVLPNIYHLSAVKTLYTQAADNILVVNGFFSIYMSLSLLIMLVGFTLDAGSLWKGLNTILDGISPWISLLAFLHEKTSGEEANEARETTKGLSPTEIREINAEVACIIILYLLAYFTIRQAIGTNDCARELNVWLNDFVTGAGGTDVTGILASLGALKDSGKCSVNPRNDKGAVLGYLDEDSEEHTPLIWAHSTMLESGMDDEFLRKFRNLKAYIHSRMQLEKPALLRLAFIGILAPSLPERLRRYRVVF